MEYCQYCGKPVEADSDFCPFCGKSLSDDSAGTQQEVHSLGAYGISRHKKKFFSVENFFSLDGRLGRLDYLKVTAFWVITNVVISTAVGIICSMLAVFLKPSLLMFISILIVCLIGLISFISSFVVSYFAFVKRLHDLNKSTSSANKWFVFNIVLCFVFLIPFYVIPKYMSVSFVCNAIYGLGWTYYLFFKKGTDGPNQYGEDPTRE